MDRTPELNCKEENCNRVPKKWKLCIKHLTVYKIKLKTKQAEEIKYPHHRLYGLAAWKKLREKKLSDNPLCEKCQQTGIDIDHIIPHKGKTELMYKYSNLQTLCKACHAIKTVEDTKMKRFKTDSKIIKITINKKHTAFEDTRILLGYPAVSERVIDIVLNSNDYKGDEIKVSSEDYIEKIKRRYSLKYKRVPQFEVVYEK